MNRRDFFHIILKVFILDRSFEGFCPKKIGAVVGNVAIPIGMVALAQEVSVKNCPTEPLQGVFLWGYLKEF
jgi:hypothetical protein